MGRQGLTPKRSHYENGNLIGPPAAQTHSKSCSIKAIDNVY
ncbi:hypothetical protein BQ8794_140189 [Mesorhizobium prunaredense]|uniref:Uncharacterized protein n=1 Tax=Mesorhizobium prunaredense TaxID=1631249 RepID=A0A1R3V2C7_9HYPH|nr:hypothetical protein BQ8794_140189 [Mesorhizobium prunaredense]